VILAVGVLDLVFEVAYGAYLPSLVDEIEVVEANSPALLRTRIQFQRVMDPHMERGDQQIRPVAPVTGSLAPERLPQPRQRKRSRSSTRSRSLPKKRSE
jgi:hypothetical protein